MQKITRFFKSGKNKKKVFYYYSITAILVTSALIIGFGSGLVPLSNANSLIQSKFEAPSSNPSDTALSVTLSSTTSAIDADGLTSARFAATPAGGSGSYVSFFWIFPSQLRPVSGCTSSSPTCTLDSTTAGIFSVSVVVTDSSHASATSNSISLSVNPVLTSVSVSPSPSSVVAGQPSVVSVSWSGGTPVYTVTLYSGPSSSSCSSDTEVVQTTTVSTTGETASITPSLTAYYCATVTDGALASSTSTPVEIAVTSGLGVPVITPSRTTIDAGQQISVAVSWTRGTSPFTVRLYSSSTSSCSSGSTLVSTQTGVTTLQFTFANVSPGASSVYYCATVTDSSSTPITQTSTAVGVVVNPSLLAPTVSVSSTSIDRGQTTFLASTTLTTGTSPYTYQWFEEATGSATFSQIGGATSSTYSFVTTSSTSPGTYSFYVVVTDSTGASVTSNTVAISVLPTVSSVSISTTLSPTSIVAGQSAFDSATLTGETSTAGGTVAYEYFTSSICLGSPTVVSTVTVTNAAIPNSASQTFAAGSYGWRVIYSGDSNNAGATSACEPLTVNPATPAMTTVVTPSSISLGSSATDTATISGGYQPTGTITYNVFSNSACTNQLESYPVTVTGNGQQPASPSFTPSSAGVFYWTAKYSGDSNNNAFTTPCGASGETLAVVSTTAVFTVSCVASSGPPAPPPHRDQEHPHFQHHPPHFPPGQQQAFEYVCTATVPGASSSSPSPPEIVVFSTSSSTGSFLPPRASCPIGPKSSCSVRYFDTKVGSVTVTATLETNPTNILGTASTAFTIPLSTTTTTVTCYQTPPRSESSGSWACTASVSGINPTGTVSFSATTSGGSSTATLSSTTCTLGTGQGRDHDFGARRYSCQVTFTDSSTSGTVTITATYQGDSNNMGSSGSTTANLAQPSPHKWF